MTTALSTGHVGLNVTDLARSVDFYATVLDLTVIGRSDEPGRRHAFLASDGALLVTLWEQAQGAFDTGRPGLHHLAFQVADVDAVLAAQGRVASAGGAFLHDGLRAHAEGASSGGIWFIDPDGTRLEVYAPAGLDGLPAAASDAPTCGFF